MILLFTAIILVILGYPAALVVFTMHRKRTQEREAQRRGFAVKVKSPDQDKP
jgi:hypothetical protein